MRFDWNKGGCGNYGSGCPDWRRVRSLIRTLVLSCKQDITDVAFFVMDFKEGIGSLKPFKYGIDNGTDIQSEELHC